MKKTPKVINLADESEEVMINNIIYMEKRYQRNGTIIFGAAVLLFLIGIAGFMTICFFIIPGVVNKWFGL